jgi:hypothetical protein
VKVGASFCGSLAYRPYPPFKVKLRSSSKRIRFLTGPKANNGVEGGEKPRPASLMIVEENYSRCFVVRGHVDRKMRGHKIMSPSVESCEDGEQILLVVELGAR